MDGHPLIHATQVVHVLVGDRGWEAGRESAYRYECTYMYGCMRGCLGSAIGNKSFAPFQQAHSPHTPSHDTNTHLHHKEAMVVREQNSFDYGRVV